MLFAVWRNVNINSQFVYNRLFLYVDQIVFDQIEVFELSWSIRPIPKDQINRKPKDRILHHTTEYIENHMTKYHI